MLLCPLPSLLFKYMLQVVRLKERLDEAEAQRQRAVDALETEMKERQRDLEKMASRHRTALATEKSKHTMEQERLTLKLRDSGRSHVRVD